MGEVKISDSISAELEVILKISSYSNTSEFVEDAINTLLFARKDLRIDLACELYKNGKISLMKACEIAKLNVEEMKKSLYDKGIKRHTLSFSETEKLANSVEHAIKD